MAEAAHDAQGRAAFGAGSRRRSAAHERTTRLTLLGNDAFSEDFDRVLREAKQGDGRAFACIDAALGGRILAFVASRGIEDPGAVTNEVFLGAFRSIDSFSGDEAAFTGWIFRIARNKIVDEHRHRSRRPRPLVPLEAAEGMTNGQSAEDVALEDPELSDVYQLLDSLTDEQREIVLMRAVSGLTFPQIGVATGKRTGAVKASFRRAIKTANRAASEQSSK